MALQDQLQQEIKQAMLAKDADRLTALRSLKSALGYILIEKKTESLGDADFITLVQREVKKRRDAVEQFTNGGRPELAAKESAEISILEIFLPKALSADELETLVRAAIQEVGATDKKQMGLVMKAAQAKAAGRADGKAINAVVSRLLP